MIDLAPRVLAYDADTAAVTSRRVRPEIAVAISCAVAVDG